MQDEHLADCLDDVLRELRSGTPLSRDDIRARFPELAGDPRLLDFFVRLCECAEDWRGAVHEPDITHTSATDTPPLEPVAALGPPPLAFGRYRVLERVAAGGMGTVYRAFDPTLGRAVAIKVPHLDRDHPRYEELAEQFVQEARLAAAVEHPNVCAVYDAGRHEGTPFAVMAFVEGPTLSSRLKSGTQLVDAGAAANIIRQVADGLQVAHRRNIIHRDIKPGNILLRAGDGQPILTDFGLARVAQEGAFVTSPGVIAGTVAYMSPEQAAGDAANIGPASDVYGLGVVLYQMVTGRLPFEGNVPALLARIQRADAPPALGLRPDLDPRLDAVIRRAMAREPADRYRNAGELAEALRAVGGSTESPPTATYTELRPVPPARSRWRKFRVPALLALVLVTGAVAALFGAFRGGALPALDGELVVRVWTDPEEVEPNPRPKLGIAVDDASREALPVRNIDLVHVEVRLTRPAYAYVFWFPGEGGGATPLYPWNPDPRVGFRVAPVQKKAAEIHSPEQLGKGWRATGPSGLDTAVLLARDRPLTRAELSELETALGTLPPTPLGSDLKECAWLWREAENAGNPWASRGSQRGINTEAARDSVDEPVFALLKRLQPQFDLVKAVRFAHVGSDYGVKRGPKPGGP